MLNKSHQFHRCSDYCPKEPKSKKGTGKKWRMIFGTKLKPCKPICHDPAIAKDKNSCQRLETPRDHPTLSQHSKYHTVC